MQKPLATAVIGGLIASTVFTLLVAPTFYIAIESLRGRRQAND
jgi:Cu/Ag efflux pump CusA